MKMNVGMGIVATAALGAFCAFAAEPAKIGGLYVQPGSQKGKIAIIDTQTRIPSAAFKDVVNTLVQDTSFNIVYERAEKGDPQTLKEKSGANVAVVILDDDASLSLLVAPENFWASMNVAKIAQGLAAEKAAARCANQLARAFSLVCGGGGSTFPGNVMNCATVADADALVFRGLPMDRRTCHINCLKTIGVTQAKLASYEEACWQGWAPKPTNKEQQDIWNEVHAAPTEPVKIKYDPKKGK